MLYMKYTRVMYITVRFDSICLEDELIWAITLPRYLPDSQAIGEASCSGKEQQASL